MLLLEDASGVFHLLKSLCLHLSRGIGSAKLDQAIELYCRAANEFKKAKNWLAAGNAFCDAAKINAKLKIRHEVARCFVDAANCYRKVDTRRKLAKDDSRSQNQRLEVLQFLFCSGCFLLVKRSRDLRRNGTVEYGSASRDELRRDFRVSLLILSVQIAGVPKLDLRVIQQSNS